MFWFIPVIFGSLLAGGAAGAVVGLICAVIAELISEDNIKDEIKAREEFKNAFKALIESKSTRTVNVTIFNKQDNNIGSFELTSEKGVSNDLHVGQILYL